MTVTFTLGSIVADGGEVISRTLHGWGLVSLSDWTSLTQSKADIIQRPQAHGAFDPGTDWRQEGAYVASLAYLGDSVADLDNAIRELTGLAAIDDLIDCTFNDGNISSTRRVSIRKIDVPEHRGRSRLTGISVSLLAPDPFAYGDTSSASTGLPKAGGGVQFPVQFPVNFGVAGDAGRAVFTNTGTAPTPLKFKVSGGMSDGFTLRCVETGNTLTFMRPLDVSDYVILDSSDASVLLNGVSPVSGFLIQDDWWTVPPGGTCTVQFNSIGVVYGVPTLELSGAPAYF